MQQKHILLVVNFCAFARYLQEDVSFDILFRKNF